MGQYPRSGWGDLNTAGFATVMSLISILSDFRASKLDQSQLFARVESLLTDNGENLDELLSSLQQIHAMSPLPLSTFVGLKKHLLAAAAPKTVWRRLEGERLMASSGNESCVRAPGWASRSLTLTDDFR
jgi:hypothetical protein